jgi:hypothetical protein
MNQDPTDRVSPEAGEVTHVADKLKVALDEAELERKRLLDARELLRELGMWIDGDPREDLKMLCSTMDGLLNDLLTGSSFSQSDALRVLRQLADCIGSGVGEARPSGRPTGVFNGGVPAMPYRKVSESMLGEILIRGGAITRGELDEALAAQKTTRKRLGEVLIAMEVIDVATLEDAFHEQREETLRMASERLVSGPQKHGLRLVEDPPPSTPPPSAS